MRNNGIIALMALFIMFSGCRKEPVQNSDLYLAGVYDTEVSAVSRDGYDVNDNELYRLAKDGFKQINSKYNSSFVSEGDKEVLAKYDKALDELKSLYNEYQSKLASGKDFGASKFSIDAYCKAYKETAEIKISECFDFDYISNTRISSPFEIRINTETSETVKGHEAILVAETKENIKIKGWKLFEADGNPLDSGLITKVVLADGEQTVFDVYYQAQKGVGVGEFYILVTFEDAFSDAFDLMIRVSHISAKQ